MYVQVIINTKTKSLDQLFTYQVPQGMGDLTSGDRIVVPFGRGDRFIDALVWRVQSEKPTFKTKKVLFVLPHQYRLSRTQLYLMQGLRSLFGATYQEAYRTVLPAPLNLKRYQTYTVLPHHPSADLFPQETFSEEDILKWMNKSQLNQGIQKGHIQLVSDFKIQQKPQVEEWLGCVDLTYDDALTKLPKRSVAKHRVLDHMYGCESAPLHAVRTACNTSRQVIMQLVDEGLLTYDVRPALVDASVYHTKIKTAPLMPLTDDQKKVVHDFVTEIEDNGSCKGLLVGVTGSGKTRVYIELAKYALEKGQQVLILAPEIALTPQLTARFTEALGSKVAVIHSNITERDRATYYEAITNKTIKVIIGARSALFAPFQDLGLIIMDEEHEGSYRSDVSPRYQTNDLVAYLADHLNLSYLLGSATPNVTSCQLADVGVLKRFDLPKRIGHAVLPRIELIDMRLMAKKSVTHLLTDPMRAGIEESLAEGGQVLLLFNRKGYAHYLQCSACGHTLQCVNCDIALTLYQKQQQLKCHYCNYATKTPPTCPKCQAPFEQKGIGIERLEEWVQEAYPKHVVKSVDADSHTKKGELANFFDAFGRGEIDILIGTQLIAKGLDFERVTLVGILQTDQMLNMPDYRATERAYQLMTQVAGRAGRHQHPGRVLVQTFQPDHPVFAYMQNQDLDGFIEEEKRMRDILGYPPYGEMMLIRVTGDFQSGVMDQAKRIYAFYQSVFKEYDIQAEIHQPYEPYYAKIKNRYRVHLVIKAQLDASKQVVKMLVRGLVNNQYQLIKEGMHVDLDFKPDRVL